MTSMQPFDALHPRSADGTFTTKHATAPEVALPATDDTNAALADALREVWDGTDPAVYALADIQDFDYHGWDAEEMERALKDDSDTTSAGARYLMEFYLSLPDVRDADHFTGPVKQMDRTQFTDQLNGLRQQLDERYDRENLAA